MGSLERPLEEGIAKGSAEPAWACAKALYHVHSREDPGGINGYLCVALWGKRLERPKSASMSINNI